MREFLVSRGPTSSPIVNAPIEARARQLAEERPWASHADNLRIAEDLLRGEFAPKPKPIPRAGPAPVILDTPKTKPAPKRVRRKAPAVEQVTMPDGS